VDDTEFFAEMRRMASQNGVMLPNQNKLQILFGPDLADGAAFINVTKGVDTEKDRHVFITTTHVTCAHVGLLRTKQLWKVRLSEIADVDIVESTFRGYIGIELVLTTAQRKLEARFCFKNPQTDPYGASALEIALNNATVAAREIDTARALAGRDAQPAAPVAPTATDDPDLAALHAALAASQDAPAGDSGSTMTPRQLERSVAISRHLYAQGRFEEVWERRLALGYGVPRDAMSQCDRFWLNAEAALAALKLGRRAHPFVATCCGLAEQDVDHGDPEQVAATAEFNRLFFG
jgi:hypothetical protein